MLRAVNLILLISVVVSAFILINQRFHTRGLHAILANTKKNTEQLELEYSKLLLEEGAYSSSLVMKDYSKNHLGLIKPDQQHIIGLK